MSMPNQEASRSSSLDMNAFHLLRVNTRDDRAKILEQAEERALHLDQAACQKARSDLTNPRTRLGVELGWLPGISPRAAEKLVDTLPGDPLGVALQKGLPELARANLLAAALELTDPDTLPASTFADFMRTLGETVDRFEPNTILREINEDRVLAGFPEVRDATVIEDELDERRKTYRVTLKNALDVMPSLKLVETITLLMERATSSGSKPAPRIIDELVDSYALETHEFLEREQTSITSLIASAREAAAGGASAVNLVLNRIERVARNWDRVVQPIQVSMMARGMTHQPSYDLGFALRSLGIDLFNKHDLLDEAQRMTTLLRELFAKVGDVSEKLEQDAAALRDLRKKAADSVKEKAAWRASVTYKADVGLLLKDELSISPEAISWKNRSYSLESITRVRWGATRRSVNGIPTGTDYSIAFGNGKNDESVSLRREETYSKFTESLWRAVCVRLLLDTVKALKAGASLQFGSISVSDDTALLQRHKIFGTEAVRLNWSEVHIWTSNGRLFLGATKDKKTYSSASYMNDWNTHILDHLVRGSFKHGVNRGLSEYWTA